MPQTEAEKWALVDEAVHTWSDEVAKELAYELGLTDHLHRPDEPLPPHTSAQLDPDD